MTTTFRERTSEREMRAPREHVAFISISVRRTPDVCVPFSATRPPMPRDTRRRTDKRTRSGFELVFFLFRFCASTFFLDVFTSPRASISPRGKNISSHYFKSCKKRRAPAPELRINESAVEYVFENGELNFRDRVALSAQSKKKKNY